MRNTKPRRSAPVRPGAGPNQPTTTTGTTPSDQRVRVPARFVVSGGQLAPPTISVPPGLPIEVTVVSRDRAKRRVTIGTRPSRVLSVGLNGSASVRLVGLRGGRYRLAVAGGGSGALVVGGAPGP
jgi:hypothetical protein